jgi:hypothetical protein
VGATLSQPLHSLQEHGFDEAGFDPGYCHPEPV